jgi:hypothetical protein
LYPAPAQTVQIVIGTGRFIFKPAFRLSLLLSFESHNSDEFSTESSTQTSGKLKARHDLRLTCYVNLKGIQPPVPRLVVANTSPSRCTYRRSKGLSLRGLSFASVGYKLDNFSATFSYQSFEDRHQQDESRTPTFGP